MWLIDKILLFLSVFVVLLLIIFSSPPIFMIFGIISGVILGHYWKLFWDSKFSKK